MDASFKATMGMASLTAVGGITVLLSTHMYQGVGPNTHNSCERNRVCSNFRDIKDMKNGSVYSVDKDSVVTDEANS